MCDYGVRSYPEVCCEEEDDEDDLMDMCKKRTPYCVSRRGCFSIGGGIEFLIVSTLSFVTFLGVIGVIAYYFTAYDVGFGWKQFGAPESKENQAIMNMHALLETIGFISLLGLSIIFFRLSNCCDRAGMRMIHLIFSVGAMVVIALGINRIYQLKKHEKKDHLLTAHAWMGAAAALLFLAEVVFGILKFIILLACGPISCCLRASCRPIHSAFGVGAYWIAISAGIAGIIRSIVYKSGQKMKYTGAVTIKQNNSPPKKIGISKTPLLSKVDVANIYTILLLACGILVTFSVISRTWGR